jgi:hypothetical protein
LLILKVIAHPQETIFIFKLVVFGLQLLFLIAVDHFLGLIIEHEDGFILFTGRISFPMPCNNLSPKCLKHNFDIHVGLAPK